MTTTDYINSLSTDNNKDLDTAIHIFAKLFQTYFELPPLNSKNFAMNLNSLEEEMAREVFIEIYQGIVNQIPLWETELKFFNDSPEYRGFNPSYYPQLATNSIGFLEPHSDTYNCYAHAQGITNRVVNEPDYLPIDPFPVFDGVFNNLQRHRVPEFESTYRISVGNDRYLEFKKNQKATCKIKIDNGSVAVYAKTSYTKSSHSKISIRVKYFEITHFAKYNNGDWESKMGGGFLLKHKKLEQLSGPFYGEVVALYV